MGAAFDVGADLVEIDLQKTADGAVVILHDDTLDRTTDGTGPVADHTLAEIQSLDAGSWLDPAFAGEPVPTLEQALAAGIGRGPLLLDQKSGLRFGAEIASALASTGFPIDDLWVTAWEADQVADIRAHVPGATVLWTATSPDDPTPEDWSDFLAAIAPLGVDGFSFVDLFLLGSPFGPDFVDQAQTQGYQVFAWNLFPATASQMHQAIDAGLDGYIVNDPALFAAAIPEPRPALLFGVFGLTALLRCARRRGNAVPEDRILAGPAEWSTVLSRAAPSVATVTRQPSIRTRWTRGSH
jgi:glycerophosphoryl diester phosphodiesterase